MAERRTAVALVMLLLAIALLALPGDAAQAFSISPLSGTPDASPQTQISFLGAPVSQITRVSVVGSRSGRHGGRLEPYVSAAGASFVPAHPFTQGERVTVSALVGATRHSRRVGSSFTVARRGYYPHVPMEPSPNPKPGTVRASFPNPRCTRRRCR